jgi:hypothetical protein
MNLTKTQAKKAAAALRNIFAAHTKDDADFSAANGFRASDPFEDLSVIEKNNTVVVSFDGMAYSLLSVYSEVDSYREEIIAKLDKMGLWIEDINGSSFEVLPR